MNNYNEAENKYFRNGDLAKVKADVGEKVWFVCNGHKTAARVEGVYIGATVITYDLMLWFDAHDETIESRRTYSINNVDQDMVERID